MGNPTAFISDMIDLEETFLHALWYRAGIQKQQDGTYRPKRGTEPLFTARSYQIGAYCGRTAQGMEVDEKWRENDGLVNTISSMAPSGAPSKTLDRLEPEKGVWNVFPVMDADHMYLQGGLMHKHDIRGFYLDLLTMISETDSQY